MDHHQIMTHHFDLLFLTILQDPKDPYKTAYDEEATILLTDQTDVPGEEELKSLEEVSACLV